MQSVSTCPCVFHANLADHLAPDQKTVIRAMAGHWGLLTWRDISAALEIAEAAHPITIRGIAYKLFTRGLIESMAKKHTDRVSTQITDARELGMIPWEWVVDETRKAERVSSWSSTDEIITAAVNGYRRDYWLSQPKWVEVWSEKGTVRGVLAPVLNEYGITFRVMHGYGSATAVNDIASETRAADRVLHVLYVGDWDPSGLHMSGEDLPSRLARYGGTCQIRRIALSSEDVAPETPLPSFSVETKKSDPRHRWFTERYGRTCWEMDAMDPDDLRQRVEGEILSQIDLSAWTRAIEVEAAEVESTREFHAAWKRSISGQASICSPEARP